MIKKNPNNYRLVKALFVKHCKENNLEVPHEPVWWDRDSYLCLALDTNKHRVYQAQRKSCPYCESGTVDCCFNCGSQNNVVLKEI